MFSLDQLRAWLNIASPINVCQTEYRSLETDSRLVTAETLFVALPGVSSNGWDYLDQAAQKGLKLALVPAGLGIHHDSVTLLEVDDIEQCLAMLARHIYGPIPKHIVAITGTNGKSSICYYVAQLAEQVGFSSAMIGTFGVGKLNALHDASHTTPDLLSLHKLLSQFANQGVDFVAFEASSHALDQQRLAGVPVTTAVFSNLTRDHLDYHGSMACYAAAKRRLFSFPSLQRSIICADSDYAEFMAQASVAPIWRYCSLNSDASKQADLFVTNERFLPSSVALELQAFGQSLNIELPLLGEFNIQNALAALAAVWHESEGDERLFQAVQDLHGAPGRMEPVRIVGAPLVLVDYAHTSDALAVALKAIRSHASGKLVCVFGCGGDRDRGKRPMMLEAAQSYADEVWLTSDNPRTEDPQMIIDDALSGQDVAKSDQLHIEIDRRHAIASALSRAASNDIVLIAGKGHETYQDIQGVRHHFDDKEEALLALENYVAGN